MKTANSNRKIDWNAGFQDGKQLGRQHGYHMGCCQSIVGMAAQRPLRYWNCRVMYVSQGSPGYLPLDLGISDALAPMAREFHALHHSEDIVSAVESYKPDLVLVLSGIYSITAGQVKEIRKRGVKTAVWLADDPYLVDLSVEIAPHYDYIFSHERSSVPLYQALGCPNVYHLPFATSASVFHPQPVYNNFRSDICFIGMAFDNRVACFDAIADYLAEKNTVIAGGGWERLKNYRLLQSKIRDDYIDPEQAVRMYSGAKVVINLHRLDAPSETNKRGLPAYSLNPRTFDIAACGALQLVDARRDLPDFYTPGKDLDVFQTPDELVQKIDFYLQNEEKRIEMALNGLRSTIQRHLMQERLADLFSVIFS